MHLFIRMKIVRRLLSCPVPVSYASSISLGVWARHQPPSHQAPAPKTCLIPFALQSLSNRFKPISDCFRPCPFSTHQIHCGAVASLTTVSCIPLAVGLLVLSSQPGWAESSIQKLYFGLDANRFRQHNKTLEQPCQLMGPGETKLPETERTAGFNLQAITHGTFLCTVRKNWDYGTSFKSKVF